MSTPSGDCAIEATVDRWVPRLFAQGVATRAHLPIGVTTNLIGAVVLLLWIPLRQRPGLGTILNVLLIGTSLDVALRFLPEPAWLPARIALCLAGILVVAVGSGLYLTSGMGPGPRLPSSDRACTAR